MLTVCLLLLSAHWLVSGWSIPSASCSISTKISACCGGGCHSRSGDVKYDLFISGAGTLGSLVGEQYLTAHPQARVVAETSGSSRHAALSKLGLECRLRSSRADECLDGCAKNVVIAIPPSAAPNYAEEVEAACRLWAGPEQGGKIVFTSSVGVNGDPDGVTVNEDSAVADGPRAQRYF